MNKLCLVALILLFTLTYQEAPLSYTLISNISVTLTSNTYVKSSSMYYVCSGQILNVYNLKTGIFAYSVNFNTIASGSTLQCYDAFQDNSYCLFNKGTTIIRFKGDTQTYDYYDNLITKTKGKLLLDGNMSVTNDPSAGKLYILDHTTNTGLLLTPDSAVTTADYSISVNLTRSIFSVFQTRKIFTYSYTAPSWNLLTNLTLSPVLGSNVYFLTYSPKGDKIYHSKGASNLNIRYSNNLTLITSIAYTGLNVVNVQFMDTIGDSIYILFWNSTSGLYTSQIYNTTTSTITQSITLTTTLKSYDIFTDNLTEVITYSSYVQVWQMSCPADSIYVSQYGNCFYCNQTDLCPIPIANVTNATNATNESNVTNLTNLTNATNESNVTNLTNATNGSNVSNLINTTNLTNSVNSTTNLTNSTNQTSSSNVTNGSTISNLTNGSSSSNFTNGSSSSNFTSGSSTSNLTNGSNTSNLTNGSSTSNFTNGTNTSNLANGTSSSNITNGTNSSNSTNITNSYSTPSNNVGYFTSLQQSLISITTKFYSFPTIRSSLKSFSYAFLAMDSLWIYYYHNRTYGSKTVQVFTAIQRVQNLKFAFLTIIEALYQALTDSQLIIQTISDYSLYTAFNFYEIQQNDGSFLSNCLDYLIYQIPFTILIFYFVRKIFYALFNYKISKYLRLYSFWGYCLISALQPNIQYFFFLLANQFRLSFSFSYRTKFFNLIWIIVFFFVAVLSTLLVFYMRYLYVKQAKFFMEGVYNQKMGLFWICFNTSIKRMCTGFVHSYFVYQPQDQIIYLIGIEIISIIVVFLFWKKERIFKQSLFACMNISFSLVFIGFQGVLFINSFVSQTDQLTLEIMDTGIYISVLSIFVTAFIFGILSSIPFSSCKAKKQDEQNQQKQKTQKEKPFRIFFAGVPNANKSMKSCINQKRNILCTNQQFFEDQQKQKIKSSIILVGKDTQLSIINHQMKDQIKEDQFCDSQMQMIKRDQKPKISIANIKNLNYSNYRKQTKKMNLPNGRKIKTYKTKIPQRRNQIVAQLNQKHSKSSVHLQEAIDTLNKSQEKGQTFKKTLKSIRFIQQMKQYPENNVQINDNIFNFNTNKSIEPSAHKIKSSKKIKDDAIVFTKKQIQIE